MTRLAIQHGAINLAQGFPDFPGPPELKAVAKAAIDADVNQYAITWGAQGFREAIAAKFERTYGVAVDPDRQLCVTCGSTEAMIAASLAVIDPGDEVIVFEPFYENYGPDAILSGAVPGMEDRTVTINALSKTYAVTGWRVGWTIASPELTDGIRKVHDFLTVGAAAPLQEAGRAAMELPDEYYRLLQMEYAERRDLMVGILDENGFKTYPPRGAYYVMTDISGFGFEDD